MLNSKFFLFHYALLEILSGDRHHYKWTHHYWTYLFLS